MAANNITIEATADGKPLEVLQELVRKRAVALRETTRDAVIATGINILTSLKAATRKAPMNKVPHQAYKIELTNLFGGLYTDGGLRKICARIGSHTGKKSDIQPAIGFAPGNNNVFNSRVYTITPYNERMTFFKNVNFPNRKWYVLATTLGQVHSYAQRRILRILRKESGMAKYTIGIAQAKLSTRPGSEVARPSGARAWRIAHGAASVTLYGGGYGSGSFGIRFVDKLDYSMAALKGGKSAFDTACMKAANKTAGLIHMAFVSYKFGEDCKTPFPEVKARR